jgi:hypothetical protein
METQHLLPLTTILLMGAFHGINPGMGWLFAVALGMQDYISRSKIELKTEFCKSSGHSRIVRHGASC